MPQRRRSTAQKLIGWSILGGAIVVVIAIFLITRAFGPSAPSTGVPATNLQAALSAAASSQAAASAAASAPSPQPSAASSAASAAATSLGAPASPQPAASSAAPIPAVAPSGTAVADAAAMDQGERRDFLNRLIGQGVFTAVVPVPAAKVGVTPLFQGLKPDLQLQFLAVAYAYIHNGAAGTDPLQLIDVTNGKVIGNFTNTAGLQPA